MRLAGEVNPPYALRPSAASRRTAHTRGDGNLATDIFLFLLMLQIAKLLMERRTKFKKTVILAVICLILLTAMSGSGNANTTGSVNGPSPTVLPSGSDPAPGKQTSKGEVNVFNWGEYIDETIFADFENEYGIKVNYSVFQSNEEMYSMLRMGGTNFDLIIPSDYMISRMISEDMLEVLNFNNIPNDSLIDDIYKDLEYDPEGKYTVAYMTGTVGLIYNSALIHDDITSWGSLFDSKYAGQILMFDNPRDAFGIALKYLGYSQNTTDENEIRKAYELLVQQKPVLQAYVMDQIYDKLESGEAAIGPFYAGPYFVMLENNPDLVFVRPVEGSNWFIDAMCVPKGAKNKTNAELFIDFMCRTDVALKNMEYIWYASANFEAAELFGADLDPDNYEVMFASHETLKNCDILTNLPAETQALYDQLWVELKK
jgi:spermidine/putrescine transport system substrate-binding protein